MNNEALLVARNLLLYLYVLLTVPPFALLILLLAVFDRRGTRPHRVATRWLRGVLWVAGVQVEVRGLERLRPNRAYIFAANHQSQFDIPVLGAVLPYQIRWLAKESLFRIPFFGWALRAVGYIPVDRTNPRRGLKSLEAAARRVREGCSVVIFPEGTRSPDGKLLPFKTGGFVLAIKSRQPVVPVALCGTRRVMPRGRLWVRPGVVRVMLDRPVPTVGLSVREKGELAELVRLRIEKMLSRGCR